MLSSPSSIMCHNQNAFRFNIKRRSSPYSVHDGDVTMYGQNFTEGLNGMTFLSLDFRFFFFSCFFLLLQLHNFYVFKYCYILFLLISLPQGSC